MRPIGSGGQDVGHSGVATGRGAFNLSSSISVGMKKTPLMEFHFIGKKDFGNGYRGDFHLFGDISFGHMATKRFKYRFNGLLWSDSRTNHQCC
ncbi:hypothetical protein [Rummeliibacillus suwonensis]|uniref:hypothetical protein n=1 Tax=Rummeliibacillus suwonensis TaxID=1306154 RepID=UPI00289CAF94|nr:hypothetical protein [Rummeliibacillus suwonensis]